MGFRVEPGPIDGFSKLVGRAADSSTQAVSYTANAQIDTMLGGALWDLVTGEHGKYVSEAKSALRKVQKVLDSSQQELAKPAQYYRETDSGVAAKMDSTYPESKGAAGRPDGGDPQNFSDASDAADLLKKPGDSTNPLVNYGQAHADEYMMSPVQKTLGSVLDLGSPSAMAVEGSKLLFGFDPFGEVTNWVFGDWNKYNNCADVWGCLAAYCDAVAANLKKGNGNVSLSWAGNASTPRGSTSTSSPGKLAEIKETFGSLETCYKQAAMMAFQFAEFLKSFLVMFCDALVIWMVNMAAAAAVNAIPVGGQAASVAMFALAAAQAIRIMGMWAEASKAFDTMATALSAIALTMATAVNGFSAADGFPEVSTGGYDHRAV